MFPFFKGAAHPFYAGRRIFSLDDLAIERAFGVCCHKIPYKIMIGVSDVIIEIGGPY